MALDRRIVFPAAAAAVLLALCLLAYASFSLKREGRILRENRKEMALLRNDYLSLRASVGAVEGRSAGARVAGVSQAVDEIFRSLGLQQKVRSVKSTGTRERTGSTEEEAEVQVEKVTLNEIVNVLYKLENAPMLLSVRRSAMKTTFENPSLFNLTVTVSLIKPK